MKNKAKDSMDNREKFQEQEKYPKVKDDVPDSRLQSDKQVAPAEETQSTASDVTGEKAPSTASVVAATAKDIKKEMSVSPNSDVEVLDGKQVGGVALAVPAQTRSFAGISDITVVDDMSRTSYTSGGSRPDTRFGKKNTVANFIIDNTISEQLAPHFDEVPNLNKDPEAEVGYNGNKQYTVARGKKNAGVAPQNMLFDRSIDLDHKSFIVHTTGQVLDNVASTASYPTVTSNPNLGTAIASRDGWYDLNADKIMHKGNYLLQSFAFHLNQDGTISNPHFNEIKIGAYAGVADKEEANMNWQCDANNVTHSMIDMQVKLGRETTEKWSPLGYVILQPYQYNMLAHDIEAMTGSIMALSYRSAAYAQAFQLNMLAKDGAKKVAPMIRAFHDSIYKEANSDWYDHSAEINGINRAIFNGSLYQQGSAAALIEMFDSVAKYTTKADILNQQRSLKMHLQSCDNNINPLHCKKEFLQAIDSVTMFSTVDGTYNPMLPIHVTDSIHIMNPMSLNFFLKGWSRPVVFDGVNTGTVDVYQYQYSDLRDKYVWTLRHPIVEGLLRWLLQHEGALKKAYNPGASGMDITWPCSFDMTTFNMFAYVMCSAAYDVAYLRNVSFKDILFAGDQSQYIWSDLGSLKEMNPLHSSQLTYVDYGSPLKLGKLTASSIIREYWQETYLPRYNSRGVGGARTTDYLLPWMLSEAAAVETADATSEFKNPSRPHLFNYPSRRSGVNNSLFDFVYSMTPQDLLLSIDRPVRIPYIVNDTGVDSATGATSDYSADVTTSMSEIKLAAYRYDVQSDGRLIETTTAGHKLTYASVLEIPRQFGYIFPDMGIGQKVFIDLITRTYDSSTNTYSYAHNDTQQSLDITLNATLDVRSSEYLESYSANGYLFNNGIALGEIDRTAALQQRYDRYFAMRDPNVVNNVNYGGNYPAGTADGVIRHGYECTVGFIPCFSGLINASNTASTVTLSTEDTKLDSVYKLGSATVADNAITYNTGSSTLSKFFWVTLQRLYFPVNPFEGSMDPSNDSVANSTDYPLATAVVDNMETAYYFGFSGFKAADFNQLVIHRMNDIDQLNVSYIKDLFISKSLIFREN